MNTTMTVEWWELRRATVTATHRGWPVTPGTVPGAGICGCPASRGAKAGGTVGEVPEHDKPTPGGRCRLQATGSTTAPGPCNW
ncbi:MAG: hypothetical protein ACRDRU_06795 [Pseudonocardiaceae bacterium]